MARVAGRTATTAARLICSSTQAANGLAFFEHSALGHARREPELTPPLYNALIDLVQVVTGYNGTEEIALAIERGEVLVIGDWSWTVPLQAGFM